MIGYIRASDSRKADGESQHEAIKSYASKHHLVITEWVEEHYIPSCLPTSKRILI